jgi:nucleotide-binding universal stress UspA family protein
MTIAHSPFMFTHLLVPLDGSALAESILPLAQSLALKLHARVTLLHVVEPAAPATIHGELHLSNAQDADAYLARIVAQFRAVGIAADRHVDLAAHNDVARVIFEHGGELRADLILLTSHGASGLREILFGSIAQQVLQSGKIPVLIIRPEIARKTFRLQKILVPLDSSALYEPALDVAAQLAKVYNAALQLVVVVPTMSTLTPERAATGTLLPSSTRAILDLAENGATDYLRKQAALLKQKALAVEATVARGDSATEIVNLAERAAPDLIVMATHGRSGLDAFWSGSVAPKVLSRARCPVLLLRVEGAEPVR